MKEKNNITIQITEEGHNIIKNISKKTGIKMYLIVEDMIKFYAKNKKLNDTLKIEELYTEKSNESITKKYNNLKSEFYIDERVRE